MAKDTLIDFADLNIVQAQPVDISEAPLLPLKDDELEKQSIIRALQSCGGVKTKAAQMLNVDSSTLYRKMKKYGIKWWLWGQYEPHIGKKLYLWAVKLKYRGGTFVVPVRLYRHKFARIPNRNLAVEVKESIAYAYAMPMA